MSPERTEGTKRTPIKYKTAVRNIFWNIVPILETFSSVGRPTRAKKFPKLEAYPENIPQGKSTKSASILENFSAFWEARVDLSDELNKPKLGKVFRKVCRMAVLYLSGVRFAPLVRSGTPHCRW